MQPAIKIGEQLQYLRRLILKCITIKRNTNHKEKLAILVNELMTDIDLKPLSYPNYHGSSPLQHSLNMVYRKHRSNCQPVYKKMARSNNTLGTLSTIFLTNIKFGFSFYPPSVKFIQCQSVLRIALKSSPNESITDLWKSTNNYTNIQYDGFKSTKKVLNDFRAGQEDKLKNQLSCQGSFFSSVTKFALNIRRKILKT